jgi:hypothetical protein
MGLTLAKIRGIANVRMQFEDLNQAAARIVREATEKY